MIDGRAGDPRLAVLNAPILDHRSGRRIVVAVQEVLDDRVMRQLGSLHADPAAAGVLEQAFVMVIVAGETVDLLSHPEHTVPIRDIVAGVRLQDRVVVENLQCLYAFRINKLFFGHAAPDRMIVCYHTAAERAPCG